MCIVVVLIENSVYSVSLAAVLDYQETADYDTADSSSSMTNEAASPVLLSPTDIIVVEQLQASPQQQAQESVLCSACNNGDEQVSPPVSPPDWPAKNIGAIPKRHNQVNFPRIPTSKYSGVLPSNLCYNVVYV